MSALGRRRKNGITCPRCSSRAARNSHIHGRQTYLCRQCGSRFTASRHAARQPSGPTVRRAHPQRYGPGSAARCRELLALLWATALALDSGATLGLQREAHAGIEWSPQSQTLIKRLRERWGSAVANDDGNLRNASDEIDIDEIHDLAQRLAAAA